MPRPETNKLPLVALAFGHLAVDIQTSGLAILIPLLHARLHLDYASAAAIVSVQYLTSSVIQPLFGLLSDRRPMRSVLPIACILAGLGTGAVLFMPSYRLVVAVVVLTGLGSALYHAAGSLQANHVSGENKATGISFFFAGGNLGYAMGPLIVVALLSLFGDRGPLGTLLPGILAAGALAAFLPYYATTGQWQARRAHLRATQARVVDSRSRVILGLGVIVLVIGLRSIIQTGLITFIPLYFAYLSPDKKAYAALLIAVFVFTGAIGTLFGGALADRFGRKPVMVVSLATVLPLLLVFLNTSGPLQVLSIALAGASLIAASSLTVIMAQELLPHNIGLASGLTLGLGFGAGGIGAAALGGIGDRYGLPTTMLVIALLPALLVLSSLLLPGKPRLEAQKVRTPAGGGAATSLQ